MSNYERPNIRAMQGYTWGEQPEDPQTIKLNTNENPYPCSPAVQAALASIQVGSLRTYPQPTAEPFRQAIALHHGLRSDNVVLTNGGDEALRLAFTTFVEPGHGFGMVRPSYSLYPVLADIHDAKIVEIDLNDDWSLPTTFAQQMNAAQVQLVCIVNPHAPSGTLVSPDVLGELATALNGVLLIDEAYIDFVDPQLTHDTTSLLKHHDNVLILRTFSKGYSLAGLRLGYLLGSESLINPVISKTRDSYNINHISQSLGLAAFSDQPYAAHTWQKVRHDRETLTNNLAQLGLESPPSQANFLLVTVPAQATMSAEDLYQHLKQSGILVRYFDHPGLQDKLRITIGTPEQNQQLIDVLTSALT